MSTIAPPQMKASKHTAQAGKYLTFGLDVEEYGIEILKVQEIVRMMDITRVPRMPEFVRGVINLRGKVIPVVDLRLKFGMSSLDATVNTCIIVVQVAAPTGGRVTIGLIVDRVSEVLDIAGTEIEATPDFGGNTRTDFILGIAKARGGVKILLDIDDVLSTAEITALPELSALSSDPKAEVGSV